MLDDAIEESCGVENNFGSPRSINPQQAQDHNKLHNYNNANNTPSSLYHMGLHPAPGVKGFFKKTGPRPGSSQQMTGFAAGVNGSGDMMQDGEDDDDDDDDGRVTYIQTYNINNNNNNNHNNNHNNNLPQLPLINTSCTNYTQRFDVNSTRLGNSLNDASAAALPMHGCGGGDQKRCVLYDNNGNDNYALLSPEADPHVMVHLFQPDSPHVGVVEVL